jgi:hypothetical protein
LAVRFLDVHREDAKTLRISKRFSLSFLIGKAVHPINSPHPLGSDRNSVNPPMQAIAASPASIEYPIRLPSNVE